MAAPALTRAARAVGWLALAGLVVLWALLTWGSDRIWWVLPWLYGPRWIAGAALVAMVPWLLLERRAALRPFALAVLLLVIGLLDVRLGIGRRLASGGIPFRVLELNAGAGSGSMPKIQRLREELAAHRPDLVVIAECGLPIPDSLQRIPGYHVRSSLTSLCLMSRTPITAWDVRDPMDAWKAGGSGAIVRAEVATAAGPLRIGLVHLETPRDALDEYGDLSTIPSLGDVTRANTRQRNEESRAAREWILAGPARPTIVAGDFNLPVESAIYGRHWGDLRNAFSRAGLGTGYTKRTRWWGVRIDHILATGDIGVRSAVLLPDIGSDHRPVLATLVLPAAQRTSTAR